MMWALDCLGPSGAVCCYSILSMHALVDGGRISSCYFYFYFVGLDLIGAITKFLRCS